MSSQAGALAASQDRAAPLLRRLPSPTAIFVAVLGVALFSITLAKGVQDPDYFWHVTAGKLIATTGQVPSTDPFSFTWGGKPWTPHEWLSELLIYRLVSAFGDMGALVVYGLLGGAIFGVLAFILRRRGVGSLAAIGACVSGAFVLVPYVTLRPQAVSWLLMAVVLGILWSLDASRPRWTLVLPLLFLLWANLHGLWVIGLGMIGVYTLFTLARRTPMAPAWRWMLGSAIGCGLATMVTPAGPIGILYPLRYIQPGNWGLANIQEWQSPNFHEPANWGLLVLIVLLALAARRGAPGWIVFLAFVGMAMALVALRNEPIFAVWATPVVAIGLDDMVRHSRPEPRRIPSIRIQTGRRFLELALGLVLAIASVLIILPASPLSVVKENREAYPVEAASVLLKMKPDARVLAEYGWGGYVIYRMYDAGGRVFVDGRNEMYSEQILNDYSTIRDVSGDWTSLTQRYGVEAMLFPPFVTIVKGPARDAGWCEAYHDAKSVLYVKDCSLLARR